MEKIKNFKIKNKYIIILSIILLIGFGIRIIGIADYPNALNVDEASAGYDAYSILTTGHDRNGNFLPVYFVAWGSGQSVLLSYLMIPFISLFGLSTLSIRLPMAIISCISLVVFYLLLKEISNKKMALIGLAFFAFFPWHILKSRWALDCNLFPDFILFFIYFLVKGLNSKKKIYYYLSFVIAGLSAYTYGTSFFFLPLFIIPLLIYLTYKKEITIKQSIISLLIVFIITLPLILFVIINTFNLPQINLPFMTIPRLSANRYEQVTSIFSGNFLENSISNFINALKVLFLQYDELDWNALYGFGTTYIFSTFFCIIGLLASFIKKNKQTEIKYSYIFSICLIISILLTFVCEPNINRLNIIFIPIIYFTVLGIYLIVCNCKKIMSILIIFIYLISFSAFIPTYFQQDWDNYFTFENNLEEVVQYISTLNKEKIYITNKIKEPYIYVLFYSKYPSQEFFNTVEYYNPNVGLRQVKHFGNYYFGNIKEINSSNSSCAYVIKKKDLNQYNINTYDFKITEFEKYLVIENK